MNLFELCNEYFSVNLKDYPNIGIDRQITKLLFYIFVGLIILAILINMRRAAKILLVKKLLVNEIFCENNAQTLTDLGVNNFATRFILTHGSSLMGIISIAGKENYTREEYKELKKQGKLKREKLNFNKARFYLNQNSLDKAQKIVDIPIPSVIHTLLFCALLMGVYTYLMLIIPELLMFINNSIG